MLDWNLSSYEKNVLSLSVSYIMQSKQSNHEIKNPDEREWGYKLQEIKFQGFHYFKLKTKQNKTNNHETVQYGFIYKDYFPLNFSSDTGKYRQTHDFGQFGVPKSVMRQSNNLFSKVTSV